MDFDVSLEDLYVGNFIELARFKAVPKPASGTRQCNCRTEMKTIQMGPGRFQVGCGLKFTEGSKFTKGLKFVDDLGIYFLDVTTASV